MEIPRRSSPLMLLTPLPRIQLFLFFLAVPAYDISLSPFCSGFQHNTIPLSSEISIQQNQQKNFPHLAIFDNKKTDNELFPHYQISNLPSYCIHIFSYRLCILFYIPIFFNCMHYIHNEIPYSILGYFSAKYGLKNIVKSHYILEI